MKKIFLPNFTGFDSKFNLNTVQLLLSQDQVGLDQLDMNFLSTFLGFYPWRIVGHMRTKLTGSREFEGDLDRVLSEQHITAEAYNGIVEFQTFNQLKRVFVEPGDEKTHLVHTAGVLQALIGGIFSYREFIASRRRTIGDHFDPHDHYPQGHHNRFVWPGQYGNLQEIWIYDLLRYYFRISQRGYEAHVSQWQADLKLGIDMTIGGIPTDITLSSELPTGQRRPLMDKKYPINLSKIKKVAGKYIAILRPNTWFSSAYSTLLREALLEPYSSLSKWQLRYGLKVIPQEFFLKGDRVDLVHQAVMEMVEETRDYVLPYMEEGDPSTKATETLIRDILSG